MVVVVVYCGQRARESDGGGKEERRMSGLGPVGVIPLPRRPFTAMTSQQTQFTSLGHGAAQHPSTATVLGKDIRPQ